METSQFWIVLVGLISNFIVGLDVIIKLRKIRKLINALLGLAIIFYFFLSYSLAEQKEMVVKKEIVSFLNDQHDGYDNRTLSEITEHLRKRGYEETVYSKAITTLLRENMLEEIDYFFYTDIQEHRSYMYKLAK